MVATVSSTLYPKITQHVSEVVAALKELERDLGSVEEGVALEPVLLVGSVKLHGTHADILVYADDRIVLQSKNVPSITVAKDNLGFAAAMASKTTATLSLRDQYLARWRSLNPHTPLDTACPVLIAGEWIGVGIQSHVAITMLPRRFVILSVCINGTWVLDSQYADIEAPDSDIYNISRGGSFTATLYPSDIPRTLSEVSTQAEAVAQCCPFALVFGMSGEGEGIVWKPALPHLNANPALWFKTKGGRFKPTFAPAPKTAAPDVQQKRDVADQLAGVWCSEDRLQQGWDVLRDGGQTRYEGLGSILEVGAE